MPDAQELAEALLDCLVDDMESTDMVVLMLEEVEIRLDRGAVEAAMRRLEGEGLVMSMEGPHPLRPSARDTWWRLTEGGWLTVAASGRLADDDADPLAGDSPPFRRAIAVLLSERPQTIAELAEALLATGGQLPGDPGHVWPHLTPAHHPADLYDRAERTVGKLALDGIVSAELTDGLRHRWALTPNGHAALKASKT